MRVNENLTQDPNLYEFYLFGLLEHLKENETTFLIHFLHGLDYSKPQG